MSNHSINRPSVRPTGLNPARPAARVVATAPESNGRMGQDSLQLRGRNGSQPTAPDATYIPSPNKSERDGSPIDMLVLYNTETAGTAKDVAKAMQDPNSRVSTHFIIGKNGTVVQPVKEDKEAWHTGKAVFQETGETDIGDRSLSIDLVNLGNGQDPYTDIQYKTLAKLVVHLEEEFQIPPDRVTADQEFLQNPTFDGARLEQEIKALKEAPKPNILQRVFGKEPKAPEVPTTFKAGRNDTVSDVAGRLGVSADELRKQNNLPPGTEELTPGQTLFVPKPKPREQDEAKIDNFESYTVAKSDTYYSVARRYGISEKQLREINDAPETGEPAPGDTLKVPQVLTSLEDQAKEKPPVQENPPAAEPPVAEPPVAEPPAAEPPAAEPPVAAPPVVENPVQDRPAPSRLPITADQVAQALYSGNSHEDQHGRENIKKNWPYLEEALVKHGITDKNALIGFFATAKVETGDFASRREHADGWAYDKSRNAELARDLGNTQPGDGPRFKGRGFVQLTGRSNYETYGKMVGVDLISNPDLALEPKIAADVMVAYFKDRNVFEKAARGDWEGARKAVNGGLNGWDTFAAAVEDLKTQVA